MNIRFDCRGNEKQFECFEQWHDQEHIRIGYGGGVGGAKSFTGVGCIFGDALTYPNTSYAIGRSALNDLRKYTRPSIDKVFREVYRLNIEYYAPFNGQDNVYNLYNGSKVYLVPMEETPTDIADNYQRFGSMELTRAWVEEAGEHGVTEKGVNALFARCGRQNNDKYGLRAKGLITFNPSKNFLYHTYYLPYRNGTLPPHMSFIMASAKDNKCLPPNYIPDLLLTISENEKQRLIFNNWEYDDDPATLCDYQAIQDLFLNEHIQPTGKRYISADLAMQGRDLFVASCWDGLIGRFPIIQGKSSGKTIEDDLRALMIDEQVPNSNIVADSDGMGNYLESYLQGIKPFHGNASSDSVEFRNYKDRCGYKLAELINARKMRIICSQEVKVEIAKELGYLKTGSMVADTSKKTLMSKKDIISQLGHSPNYLDNLIMRMAFELNQSDGSFVLRENNIPLPMNTAEIYYKGRKITKLN